MRIRGVQAEKHVHWKDISDFPTNYYNPCRTDIWNVVCITFDVKTPSNSLLWVNQGKICNFTCHTPMRDCSINFYNNAVPTHALGFNGFVIGLDLFHHYGLTQSYMTLLCDKYHIAPLPGSLAATL